MWRGEKENPDCEAWIQETNSELSSGLKVLNNRATAEDI